MRKCQEISLVLLLFFSFLLFFLRGVFTLAARGRDFVERDQIRIAGFCREISSVGF
jgi:hypothetical protein